MHLTCIVYREHWAFLFVFLLSFWAQWLWFSHFRQFFCIIWKIESQIQNSDIKWNIDDDYFSFYSKVHLSRVWKSGLKTISLQIHQLCYALLHFHLTNILTNWLGWKGLRSNPSLVISKNCFTFDSSVGCALNSCFSMTELVIFYSFWLFLCFLKISPLSLQLMVA